MTPTNNPPGDRDGQVTLEDLIAFRDGDLDAEKARHVTARLESDPAAAALLDEVDETDAILQRLRNRIDRYALGSVLAVRGLTYRAEDWEREGRR